MLMEKDLSGTNYNELYNNCTSVLEKSITKIKQQLKLKVIIFRYHSLSHYTF